VSGETKRRLAPFPAEWKDIPTTELERLCVAARVANPPRFDKARPRIRRATPKSVPATPEVSAPAESKGADNDTGLVRDVVRVFAQEARRNRIPAIEAMVRLKALLAERYNGAEQQDPATRSDLSDMRRIRRWFVEAFYFERPA
jgi:hypothetical protein